MSRDIFKFIQPDLWISFQKRAYEEFGLLVAISCVDRTFDEQSAYWAQGREPLDHVNKLRKVAGLSPITKEINKRKITWTWNSKHLINMDDNEVSNNKSRAIDFYIVKDGKAIWDIKADVNKDNIEDYKQLAILAEEQGFKSGFFWKNPDPVHIEIC